jgi:hypothetical protein
MAQSGKAGWRPLALRLTLELVVVFVGVYAAFAISEYQAARDAAGRRLQIQDALILEIKDITRNTRNAATEFGRLVQRFEAAGGSERPIPVPILEAVRLQNHMWESVIGLGGLELMDVATVYRLSDFYNELNGGLAHLDQLRQLSQTFILPDLDRGVTAFYDESGKLRPRFSWYLPGLRALEAVAGRITNKGDSLVAELGRLDDEGAT